MRSSLTALIAFTLGSAVFGQAPFARYDDPVPRHVEQMYAKGLRYLAKTHSEGKWSGSYGRQTGVVGLAVLAFLAHGEDPNTGPYSQIIRKGLSYIISRQQETGYTGSSMYNHGFATLALAEAYGTIDDPKIGPALNKAVKLLLSSQANNPYGAWRYSSSSNSADTTVSGACMVALFAARNAGIEVPESAIRKGLAYYQSCQSPNGGFGYTSAGGSSPERGAIGALVYALARKRKSQAYKAAKLHIQTSGPNASHSYHYYYLYYAAQAFFHSEAKLWKQWNTENIATLRSTQQADGSWQGSRGPVFSTATALLSLALNYRFLPIYER